MSHGNIYSVTVTAWKKDQRGNLRKEPLASGRPSWQNLGRPIHAQVHWQNSSTSPSTLGKSSSAHHMLKPCITMASIDVVHLCEPIAH